jgi:hypothetical protein
MEKNIRQSARLDGFDPLAAEDHDLNQVLEDANRRVVYNILKSYTGYYDLFSELLQNALDAVQGKHGLEIEGYQPTIYITIDIQGSSVRVVDNGVGMNEEQFKFCLRPNVSFKRQQDLRGQKGVGATFLAYGYSFIKLQSKTNASKLAALLRQGRQWAEDESGNVPRPRFEAVEFAVPELTNETSGTSVEIVLGQSAGERPRNMSWIGAQTAEQWIDVLRIKTPLGGVYLSSPAKFLPKIELRVRSAEGSWTQVSTDRAEYYYPHEIPNLKAQTLTDIQKSIAAITGDPATQFTKLSPDFKKLDCIWDIWTKDDLLNEKSLFYSALDEEDRLLIERHRVIVYAVFLRSAKIWGEFNEDVLKLRKGQRIIYGGLQIATDFMVQGDLSIIPLTSTIGYQANSHVVVHFTDGSPDLGRKVFQPELTKLAEDLAVRAVNTMKRYLQHMKPDTGAKTITPDRELHEWKKYQEEYRERNSLSLKLDSFPLALVSFPQQEQDVVALFHELVGMGVLKGFKFYASSQSDRYDCLFYMDYEGGSQVLFDRADNRIGINRVYELPYITEPKVLEYKYSFDSLVADIDKEIKFEKQIDFVVCWQIGHKYKERFYLQSLLVGDEGSSRDIFGATHQAFAVGSQSQPSFEILVLEDFLNWIKDPTSEEARQSQMYQ